MQTDDAITRITMTPSILADLDEVNEQINAQVTWVSDMVKYGVGDKWEDATQEGNQGDCEDFAIAKWHELLSKFPDDFPKSAIDLAICYDSQTQLHAVLIIRALPVDMCLDSEKFDVTSWDDEIASGYRFVETTVGGNILKNSWRTVPDDAQPGAPPMPVGGSTLG